MLKFLVFGVVETVRFAFVRKRGGKGGREGVGFNPGRNADAEYE